MFFRLQSVVTGTVQSKVEAQVEARVEPGSGVSGAVVRANITLELARRPNFHSVIALVGRPVELAIALL